MIMYNHICKFCNAQFESKKLSSKFCSRSCNSKNTHSSGNSGGFAAKTVEEIWTEKFDPATVAILIEEKRKKQIASHIGGLREKLSDEEYEMYLKKIKISWETRFGKVKSDQMKQSSSQRLSGRSLEEVYGYDKAENIKRSLRERKNPFEGKRHSDQSRFLMSESHKLRIQKMSEKDRTRFMMGGNSWKGWYKGVFFRSTLEYAFLKYMEERNVEVLDIKPEAFKIPYRLQNSDRDSWYIPDFYLPKLGVVYETKMSFALEKEDVKAKHAAADLYCKARGLNFVILTEKELGYVWDTIQSVINNDKNVQLVKGKM